MSERFDKAAKEWDKNDQRTQLSSNIANTILKHITLTPQMHIMDFGAGTGLLSSHIVDNVAKISAVDISQGMLDELVSKEELRSKVVACAQDIMHDPLREKCDGIISAMALHHVEDTPAILKVFYEHLNKGAFIALADLDREDGTFHSHGSDGVFHCGFEREALQSDLEIAGFQDVMFHTAHTFERENGRNYPVFLVTAHT